VCDNCPSQSNPLQVDCDSNGTGQVCQGGLQNFCKVDDPAICANPQCV